MAEFRWETDADDSRIKLDLSRYPQTLTKIGAWLLSNNQSELQLSMDTLRKSLVNGSILCLVFQVCVVPYQIDMAIVIHRAVDSMSHTLKQDWRDFLQSKAVSAKYSVALKKLNEKFFRTNILVNWAEVLEIIKVS